MFEVGFSEMAVIAVIALIVLGPERLPKAARMAGTFLRKARQSFENLKSEVERELEADELKKQFAQIAAAPAAISNALQQPFAEVKAALEHNVDAVMQPLKETVQDISEPSSLPAELNAPQSAETSSDLDLTAKINQTSVDKPLIAPATTAAP